MADSIVNHIDKARIFREIFESEASVRRNGGTPTGVTFSNGVISYTNQSQYISNNRFRGKGTFSIRIKFYSSGTYAGNRWMFDFRSSATAGAGEGSINNGTTTIRSSSGTIYNNGIASTTLIVGWNDVIFSGVTVDAKAFFIGNAYVLSLGMINCNMELFEIYSGTLTSQEVKNLYENKRYREIPIGTSEQLTSLMNVSSCQNYSGANAYVVFSGASSTGFTAGSDGSILQIAGTADEITIISGARYRVTFNLTLNSGVLPDGVRFASALGGTSRSDTVIPTSGANSIVLTASANDTGVLQFWHAIAKTGNYTISNLSVKQITIEGIQEILNVCACDGVVRNKYSGDPYVNLVLDSGFDNATKWTCAGTWVVSGGVASCVAETGNISQTAACFTVGKTYQVTYDIKNYVAGSVRIRAGATYGNINSGNGTFTETITCTTSTTLIIDGSTAFTGSIDNITAKEIIPSVTLTSITARKENDVISPEFNGTTSKIDCGSYDGLIGDKTFVAWIKNKPFIGSIYGRIFTNAKLFISVRQDTSRIEVTSDGATIIHSGTSSLPVIKPYLVIVTRTSTGIVNIYINGVLTGSANQSSGTPAAGTTNLFIGSTGSATWFNGLIPSVRIYNGILTLEQISEIFSNEKRQYGL